jgi:hypothetical protein
MSDTSNAAPKIYATLVRGALYKYHGKTFVPGEPLEVTAAQAAYLKEYAVDILTVEGEEVIRPKFAISNSGDAASVSGPKSRPRTRTR